LFPDRIHPEVESLQGARAKQHEIARLAEHDVVRRPLPRDADQRRTDPTRDDGAGGLPEALLLVTLDAERFEEFGRHPRQLGAGVHQHGRQRTRLPRARGVLDLDLDSERSLSVAHQ